MQSLASSPVHPAPPAPRPWDAVLSEIQKSWAATYLESRPKPTVVPVPVPPRLPGC